MRQNVRLRINILQLDYICNFIIIYFIKYIFFQHPTIFALFIIAKPINGHIFYTMNNMNHNMDVQHEIFINVILTCLIPLCPF